MNNVFTYDFEKITLIVQPFAGMVNYELDFNGRKITPLAVAKWRDDEDERMKSQPPILHKLQGEWACVPFGYSEKEEFPHGFSANNTWEVSVVEDGVELSIDYPKNFKIEKLTKKITPTYNDGVFTIHHSLEITPREDCELPLGIHPCFKVSKEALKTQINPPNCAFGLSYPNKEDNKDTTIVKPLQEFSSLSEVLLANGKDKQSFLQLPLKEKAEEVLQLCDVTTGEFYIENNEEKFSSLLKWNKEHFPSLLLWVSNGGRDYYPWNSENYNLGAEPISSYFDLGTELSQSEDNFINQKLDKKITATKLTKNIIFKTEYSLEFKEI